MFTALSVAALVGYLFGSLPFGYLVARANGVNIFEQGSRNPGATNVRRVCGKRAGYLVFLLDALKGVFAAGWPLLLAAVALGQRDIVVSGVFLYGQEFAGMMAIVGLLAALLGHCFSCFTGFRGGKGVATTVGGVLVLMPLAILVAAVVWVVVFYLLRYVSLASILSALTLPVAAYFLGQPRLLVATAAVVALLVVLRHRANLLRLLNGTENRFIRKTGTAK